MKMQYQTELAGALALALVAGGGIAGAQDTPEQNKTPQGKPPAAQQMNKDQGIRKMGQNELDQSKQGPTAQSEKMRTNKSAQRTHITHKSAAAQQRNRRMATEHNRVR